MTLSGALAPLVSANSAEVPGVTCSRTCLMKSSSIPTSAIDPVSAPMLAPIAAPRKGTKKISPNRKPQKAPPIAPAPDVLANWRVLGFLLPSGQVTTAASCRIIIWRSCSPFRTKCAGSPFHALRRIRPEEDLAAKTRSLCCAIGLAAGVPGAGDGSTEDGHHADGVLVAELDRLLAIEVETVTLHRHVAGLDLEVVAELLPADLDVYAHDHVRFVGALPGRAPPLLPATLEGHPTEHGRLAGARGRAPRSLVGTRGVPKAAQHVDAAHLKLGRLGVFVLVDHVLVEGLGHQPLGLGLHVRGHKRREVQAGVAVEHELIMDYLVGHVRHHRPVRKAVLGDALDFAGEERIDREPLLVGAVAIYLRVQCHRSAPFGRIYFRGG